jgi:hypothetical protein
VLDPEGAAVTDRIERGQSIHRRFAEVKRIGELHMAENIANVAQQPRNIFAGRRLLVKIEQDPATGSSDSATQLGCLSGGSQKHPRAARSMINGLEQECDGKRLANVRTAMQQIDRVPSLRGDTLRGIALSQNDAERSPPDAIGRFDGTAHVAQHFKCQVGTSRREYWATEIDEAREANERHSTAEQFAPHLRLQFRRFRAQARVFDRPETRGSKEADLLDRIGAGMVMEGA